MFTILRFFLVIISTGIVAVLTQSCFGPVGMAEIKYKPLPLIDENSRFVKYEDSGDDVSIELRKAPVSKSVENLAIHYPSLFPDGETIHPGDREEYVTVNGKTAYKVIFNTKYIRKRKRLKTKSGKSPEDIPSGWSESIWDDPVSGVKTPILVGPVIPERKILYLIPGSENVYYVLLKVDGPDYEDAIKKFDKFVKEGIDYR
ncbi:MAG: hypothetical protein WC647_12260 [Desulfomonilaceae bacterium]|jgi:hypothetical protein